MLPEMDKRSGVVGDLGFLVVSCGFLLGWVFQQSVESNLGDFDVGGVPGYPLEALRLERGREASKQRAQDHGW